MSVLFLTGMRTSLCTRVAKGSESHEWFLTNPMTMAAVPEALFIPGCLQGYVRGFLKFGVVEINYLVSTWAARRPGAERKLFNLRIQLYNPTINLVLNLETLRVN